MKTNTLFLALFLQGCWFNQDDQAPAGNDPFYLGVGSERIFERKVRVSPGLTGTETGADKAIRIRITGQVRKGDTVLYSFLYSETITDTIQPGMFYALSDA